MLLSNKLKEFAHLLYTWLSALLVSVAAGAVPVVLLGILAEQLLDDLLQLRADILGAGILKLLYDIQFRQLWLKYMRN